MEVPLFTYVAFRVASLPSTMIEGLPMSVNIDTPVEVEVEVEVEDEDVVSELWTEAVLVVLVVNEPWTEVVLVAPTELNVLSVLV